MQTPRTIRVDEIMRLAQNHAKDLNHQYVGTESILMGLLKTGGGPALSIIEKYTKPEMICGEIAKYCRPEEKKVIPRDPIPLTPRSKAVMDYALEESKGMGKDYLGTEHLLLGLLREQEGFAAHLLMHFGLEVAKVRKEITNLLNPGSK